ncbi:stable plasmid inheritance protein PemK [Fusobacterium animalis ATCC 51191]|uniref:mRNA interferase n=1 Tax=Fusobacterium animalis ATCC 51191 TaxID=997347 RepID=F9ERS7_9FUSO|nr:stable plasmid inheritance protein PemK [Fusobacterium animalis ATCC 51191]
MVERGDIIIINFDPVKGYEQAGKRPALVISNEKFYRIFKLAVILPITNNTKDFPFHVLLDDRTNIKGAILCEHLRTVDLEERKYNKVEKLPENLLEEVLEKVSLIFQ